MMYGFEWERIHAGYYVRQDGVEITKLGPKRWVLTHPYREEAAYRSLREAKEAAER